MLALTVGLGLCAGPVSAQTPTDSTYTVKSGDTLYSIARDVGVSVRRLMQWNDLDDTSLRVGQTLRIRPPSPSSDRTDDLERNGPTPSTDEQQDEPTPAPSDSAVARASSSRYQPAPGDTFVSIALQLGTTADSLYVLNDSTTTPLSPGEPIRVPRRFGPPSHVVEEGETLYSIAGQYGVSVRALKVENDLASDTLTPGQELRVPGPRASEGASQDAWAAPDTSGRVDIYPDAFAGRLTASGATYDPNEFVISHPSLPFNSLVLLSAEQENKPTFARVIDRGPVEAGVLLDVSRAVAEHLGLANEPSSSVNVRVVWINRESP